MSAPFRDLFIELPDALFAILRDIGEQAVNGESVNASSVAAQFRLPQLRLIISDYIRLTSDRYGWSDVECRRVTYDAFTMLVATLACGHRQRYMIDDMDIRACRSVVDEIDLLDRVVERAGRGCSCVVRQ